MASFVLLLVVVVLGGSALLYNRKQVKRREAARLAELESQLATSKHAADEDVTKFGEELQRLDIDVAGHPLDEPMQQDYQRALDAYEDAKVSLGAVRRPEEIRHVTEILEDGRYAIACVKARVAKQPLPQKRPPCFFNPAHGPSTQNVQWSPPGGSVRDVPACAADAERVLAGADPYIRTVQMGARRVPYWEGGPAYAPWAQGYYNSWRGSDLLTGMMVGELLFGGMNSMGGLFGGLGTGIGAIGEGLGTGIEGIGDGIGDAFGDIGNDIGDMFDGFFGGN
jgi:hypothetical protein